MIPVILCGGVGTKMWPESRQDSPKQFLPLFNGKSLFQLNWEALRLKFAPEDIYIQTNELQAQLAREQVSEIVEENIFLEPEMRNQGPASGFAAAMLYKQFPDEPFMLVQADVLRLPSNKFIEMIEVCDRLAKETGKYITGGIAPTYAVMGVDYLVPGARVSEEGEAGVYSVDKFLWRATKEETSKYIQEGALIHANHTCMTPRAFLNMLKQYRTDWYEPLMRIIEGGDAASEYATMPAGPIEEVTQKVHAAGESLVVQLPFDWIDFGTWESLMNFAAPQKTTDAAHIEEIDSSNNFVRVQNGKQVALVGVQDLIVVDTEDALLICHKNKSGKVGEIVNRLKKQGKDDLL